MQAWFESLKRGLSRSPSEDRLATKEGRGSAQRNLQNLKPFVSRHWRKGLIGALLILLGTLLSLPVPLITRYLIDDVILRGELQLLLGTVLLLAVVKGMGMLAELLQRFYFTRFEQQILLDIQQHLLDRTLRFPKSFFDDQEVGYLMSRLSSDVIGLRWFFSSTLVHIAGNALRFVGGAALLLYLEWRLALAVVVLLPGLVLAVRYFAGKLRILGRQGMEHQAQVSRRMQESLSAASLIKAFASEGREVDRIMSEQRQAFQISLEQVVVGSVANLSISTISDIARMVVLLAGGYLVIAANWTLGSLLAFQSYLGYIYDPARFLAAANLQLQNALAALERVSALFDIVPEETGRGAPVRRLRGEVELRNVSFTYDGSTPVLEDVSCHIRPGERVALVGPSGVGKTTLISLLLRFYQPTRGEIWFDGRPASAYDLASLRQRIGYAAQSSLLLSGTVEENLRYGNAQASHEEVIHAARTAGIHDFIAGLPQGYASPVGERGLKLSEGQKQRLSIARALLKNPDILVLDEPTSALDSAVERSIFDALPAMIRDRTLFVVAHRLSTVQQSDRILLLNEKRLVAVGTHRQLLADNDYYRSLVANQQISGLGNQ